MRRKRRREKGQEARGEGREREEKAILDVEEVSIRQESAKGHPQPPFKQGVHAPVAAFAGKLHSLAILSL